MKQQADLITHLCRFSQNVLVVIAPQWGGKTAFVDYYLALSTPGLRKHAVKGGRWQVEPLMQDIAEGFGLPWEEGKGLSLPEDALHATWVLLVDDAHLLPLAPLQALLELVNVDVAPHRQLHVVLFGEPALESRLSGSDLGTLHDKLSIIELEPEAKGEVREEKGKEKKRAVKMRKWMRSVSIGLLLGTIGAGSYLFLNRTLTATTEEIPVNAAQVMEEGWEVETISPQKKPLLTIEEMAQAQEIAEEAAPAAVAVEEEGEEITEDIKEEVKEEVKEVKEERKQRITAMPKQGGKTAEEKHLLSVDQHYYTLQLVGARKESGVKHFIQRHAIEEKAYYFKTVLGGKEWYVVVYGEYPSLVKAKEAIAAMPDSMKQEKLSPWVRTMKEIHQDIKQEMKEAS